MERHGNRLSRDFPPYAASVGWYAEALAALAEGMPYPGAEGRHPNRTLIAGSAATEWLIVPVAGSASALKSTAGRPLLLSNHGDWPRRHLAALEAAYGRTPYWPHYSPELASILTDPGTTLSGLCRSIDTFVRRVIPIEDTAAAIAGGRLHCHIGAPVHPWPRHRPLPPEVEISTLSVLDLLFCRGAEAILTLAPPL